MNINLQRKIDRIVGRPICWLLTLFSIRKKLRTEGIEPRRILVIMLSEMGSLVLAQPMFDYLRLKYPKARLYALLFEKNRECLELFDAVPKQNIFTVNGDSFLGLGKDSIRVLGKMRREKIDTVIDCELFSRISSIYSCLSGAAIRVGFHPHTQEGLYRGDFINRPVLYNPYQHISEQFLTLAHAVDSSADGIPLVKRNVGGDNRQVTQLKVEGESTEALNGRLMGDFPEICGKPLVLIYPGGGVLPIRAWPENNFCTVAGELIERGYAVGIIGLREDCDLAQEIRFTLQSDLCIDLTGYTRSVRELIVLFHLASLLITNDGGPGHFAALTPISAIVLYGPETPVLYGPLGANAVSLHVSLSCSPCLTAYNHRNSPCDGNNVCLKSISPEKVLDEAYKLLKGVA